MPAHHDDSLLRPIPGEEPAGESAHFAIELSPELRELRREEAADEFDDATRPQVLKRADWPAVQRACEESLRERSKDLRTACHLTEAWTRLEGLAGLARGIDLVARLIESCWERLNPPLGDDPCESRGTPLANLLDDPDRGVCFPNLLRTAPLIGVGEAALSYGEWTRLRSGDDSQRLDRLRDPSLTPVLTEQLAAAGHALERLDDLRNQLERRLGDEAPALLNLRAALSDVIGLLEDELPRFGPAVALPEPERAPTDQAPVVAAASTDREEIYAVLDGAAERLRAMEPHSPIPYLIKRAVRLGRLPFPSLMEQVIREPSALTELNREFGIAEQEGSTSMV